MVSFVNVLKFPAASVEQLTIERSESFNHETGIDSAYKSSNAHDGDYDTWYAVNNDSVAGNFLKLYLSQAYRITEVKMTSRGGDVMYSKRMINTEVRVYSIGRGETEVKNCGKITGKYRKFMSEMN